MRKLLLALLLAPTAACNFLEFDDLKDDVAIISLDSPDSKFTDYGIALERGRKDSPDGGSLIILGNARIAYTRYDIEADGAMTRTASVDMQTIQGSPQQVQPESQLISDPEGDQVTLVTPTMQANEVGIYNNPSGGTIESSNITAATFLHSATYVKTDSSHLIVVAGTDETTSFLAREAVAPEQGAQKCALKDAAGADFSARAVVGQFASNGTTEDLVVLTSDSRLIVFDGAVASCMNGTMANALPGRVLQLDFGFAPGDATRMFSLGDEYVVLAARQDIPGKGSSINVIRVRNTGELMNAPKVIGDPKVEDFLGGVSVYESSPGTGFIAAGYPERTSNGTEAAGEIMVYNLSDAGIGTEVGHIARSSPSKGDRLGRAVSLFELNGEPMVAAGGNQHAYLFFSAGAFYTDRRTGHGE